jgi:murein DD-endopeptidase MepM/ murein hydrolase activator NlpD
VGDTGTSYGSHLHFELHVDKVPVDPFAWLTANAVN